MATKQKKFKYLFTNMFQLNLNTPSRFKLLLIFTFYAMFDHCLIQNINSNTQIISHISNIFSDKLKRNKIYDNSLKIE
jgi:hypothetical protein